MLHPDIKKRIDELVAKLKSTYQDDLVSVILYGSAAAGEYSRRHSNVNLLVVLKDASLPNLAKISAVTGSFRFRKIVPIFMTKAYIKSSCDVFPIEFLDIKENSLALYGKNIVADIVVDLKNLRFQCEQEVKLKLLNIRRAYLGNVGRRELEKLLFKTLTSSLHVLRNLIRLKGRVPPYEKEKILKALKTEFGLDTAAPELILVAKNSGRKLSPKELEDLLSDLVGFLERASDILDGWNG